MIPYSLGSSVVSATSGVVVSHIGKYRQIIWLGFFLMTIGYGLITKLDDTSNMSVLVTSGFHSPTDSLQRRASSLPTYRSTRDGLFVPDPAHCVAGGDAPEALPYYALVIATGIRSPTAATTLHGDHTISMKALEDMNTRLAAATEVIVGGGGCDCL